MASQLNIKDPETIRLAREMAASSGRSVTAVIRNALEREERAQEDKLAKLVADVEAISASFCRNLPAEWRGKSSKEIQDEIYDGDGLPI